MSCFRDLQNSLEVSWMNSCSHQILEVSHNHYRERRKQYPALPKSREGVHHALTQMDTKTSRDEEFLLVNNEESGT